jgi:hypothetical protein
LTLPKKDLIPGLQICKKQQNKLTSHYHFQNKDGSLLEKSKALWP